MPTERPNLTENLQPISKQSMWAYIAQTCSNWDLISQRALPATEQCNTGWGFWRLQAGNVIWQRWGLPLRDEGQKTAGIWDGVTGDLYWEGTVTVQPALWASLMPRNVLGSDVVLVFLLLVYSIGYHLSAIIQNNGGSSLPWRALWLVMLARQSTTMVHTEVKSNTIGWIAIKIKFRRDVNGPQRMTSTDFGVFLTFPHIRG